MSGLYSLFPEEGTGSIPVERSWPDTWPYNERQGVYVIFGQDCSEPLYIGKASMNNFLGDRLSDYFGYDKPARRCRIKDINWSERPMYIVTVPVPMGMAFEAAALEEYLIGRFQPADNKRGKSLAAGA